MQFQQLLKTSDQAKNTQVFHLQTEVQRAINAFRIENTVKLPMTAAEKLNLKRERKNYNMEARNKSSVFIAAKNNILAAIAQHSTPTWGNLILHV